MKALKFNWEKLGIILEKMPSNNWSKSYLQFPAVLNIKDKIKVFVTTRPERTSDGKHVTYIRSFDLDSDNLLKAKNFSSNPVIYHGSNGEFDQFGTMPGDFAEFNDKIYMYYTGWNRLDSVPYNFSVGLAISDDHGKTFVKYSNGPLIGQTYRTPLSCGSGAVIRKGDELHMFCISGIKWIYINDKLEHTYTIKHAISKDGINWNILDGDTINQMNDFEAIAAPTVIKIDNVYHMWYSYRGSHNFRGGDDSYKIGYAYSNNLYDWIRDDDKSGIQCSKDGWDSEMICYPYVFVHRSSYYMLYNGNNFGEYSLGLAKLNLE